MNDDIRQRRRQVAWFCFEPYLPEDNLIQAIELLEQRFQLDGVNILISYVTTVCALFEIHKDIGKSLCVNFFELMAAHKGIELPRDPLLLVEEKRLNVIRQQALKRDNEKKNIPPVEDIPAHSVIFICFLKHIISYSFTDHETLIKLLRLCCERDKKIKQELRTAVYSWSQNPQSFRWVLGINEDKLAEMTHLLYVCVCEMAGPVEADQTFHKAIAICEQRPEAKKFTPSRLF